MINAAVLALIAAAAVVNGLDTEALAMWRQLLFLALAVAAYLHGRRLPCRWGAQVLLVEAVLTALIAVVDLGEAVSASAVLGVFVMLPWFVGRYRRQQVELLRAGEERVARLERERELVAERAQAQERARIAADLHDSVGHDLALIALRAGALELAPALAEPDREAAAALRASAVEATDRLRHALGTLREGAAPVTPFDEPVEALVERSVRAGMEVRLEVETEPLRPLVDRAVYRVVQEALTNAAKHAAGTAVTVRIRQRGDVVRMAVVNAGGKVPTGTGLRWESSTAPTGSAPMKADAVWAGRTGTESAGSGPAAGPLRERLPGESVPSGSGPAAPVDSGRRELEGPPRASVSGGAGLAGLAERVRLLGGTFTAGPRGGGFAVEAELPVRGDA